MHAPGPIPSPRSKARGGLSLFVTGVACAAGAVALWFAVLDRIEQREFDRLVEEARTVLPLTQPHTDADVLRLMGRVNGVLKSIHVQPGADSSDEIPVTSSDEHLHNPIGACASYSHVLAKTLMTAGYDVRKVGLAKDTRHAIHHVIEVRRDSRWVLLDAFYDLSFRARDGHLASAAEVSRDWAWFRQQVPPGYNAEYDYSEFYYTNWDRVPVVGWLARASPWLGAKLKASGVSLRFWFFNTYRWIAGTAVVAMITAWWARRRWCR